MRIPYLTLHILTLESIAEACSKHKKKSSTYEYTKTHIREINITSMPIRLRFNIYIAPKIRLKFCNFPKDKPTKASKQDPQNN